MKQKLEVLEGCHNSALGGGHFGRIQEFGKGESDIYIHNWGEGAGGGVPPPVTVRGYLGSADSSPSGVWGEAQVAFLLWRLFSMKFTVVSNTYTSRDIQITRARKLFILHNAMVPTGQQLNS